MHGKPQCCFGKQTAALAVCLLMLAGFILTAVFIFAHADHSHDQCGPEGGCAACAQLQNAAEQLKQSVSQSGGDRSVLLPLYAIATAFCLMLVLSDTQTPVRLKTRLNQ